MKTKFTIPNVILASQSPRRQELIKKLNIKFKIIVPDFDEKLENDDYTDTKIKSLSLNKAMSVLVKIQEARTDSSLSKTFCDVEGSLIISADTVVVLDNKILGKPKNEENAIEMLCSLSGKKHFVVTAVTVLDTKTQKAYSDIVKTFVTFCDLSEKQILDYVATKSPLDKAGAYGIQELGSDFIKSVEGDLDNVIGLPTKALKNLLKKTRFGAGFKLNI